MTPHFHDKFARQRKRHLGTKQFQPLHTDSFASLELSPVIEKAVSDAGYERPTSVQAGVIPLALEGYDVIGQARTGTGKTAAFVLPVLEQLDPESHTKRPQVLILVPTRELAVQVQQEVRKLSHGLKIKSASIYGGKPIKSQIDKLNRGVHIVIGTPGRIIDHLMRRTLVLSDLWCVVLDEADRMLDIGFRPDIEKILRRCPKERQTLMFSATVPGPIKLLAKRYMHCPRLLNFSKSDISAETIDQNYFTVDPKQKTELLLKLLEREQPQQAIVFCRTKIGTEKLYRRLQKQMKSVVCLHGDMTQSARDSVMQGFREGKHTCLVATDVVGRGIDVSGISHIINYDVPHLSEDYVHRVGRTGRMGREGVAYTFVTPEEGGYLTEIEKMINKLLKQDHIEGIDEPEPITGPTPEEDKPPSPPSSGRTKKRYRRAL